MPSDFDGSPEDIDRRNLPPMAKMWRLARVHRAAKVCERWTLFPSFLNDVGLRPRGMILVRIDESEPLDWRTAAGWIGSALASTPKHKDIGLSVV
jgi:hypothetical protein